MIIIPSNVKKQTVKILRIVDETMEAGPDEEFYVIAEDKNGLLQDILFDHLVKYATTRQEDASIVQDLLHKGISVKDFMLLDGVELAEKFFEISTGHWYEIIMADSYSMKE